MAFLIKPHQERCRELGISKLSHIPGVWSKDWKPVPEAMDYLIWKGTGRWASGKVRSGYADWTALSAASMLAIGNDVTNFLDWCERRRLQWRDLSYSQLVDRYQGDMTSGKWSQINKGRSLSPSTVNRRMLSVIDFLTFSASRGLRPPFEVEYTEVPNPGIGHNSLAMQRDGKVRQHPSQLRLPTLKETSCWLEDLKLKHGITPHLMAKTAVGIGLRAEEILLLRVDQVPQVPLGPAKTVNMTVCYGTKGGRGTNDPEKLGKSRIVRVPVDLIKELRGYIKVHRKLCLKQYRLKNPGSADPKELFLSKHTGEKLSYSRFYELWRSSAQPFDHFSPHIGRHMWACYTLLDKIREEIELAVGATGPIEALVKNIHTNLIETWISTQLGHVDSRTSEMYLHWVVEQFELQHHRETWWDFLNG